MPIKIEKTNDLYTQRWHDGNGRYVIKNLISRASELEVKEMPLEHLNIYNLSFTSEKPTMREWVGHMKAVLEADLQYPIILDDEGYVMDGRHRIARALLEGRETIKFVRFDRTPDPDYYVDED